MTHRGFTLIEAMVAVSIMAIAIAAPMYAASRTIAAAQLSAEKLTATYLAQEGVEYVRKVRDDAYLQHIADLSTAWAEFTNRVAVCTGSQIGCTVDSISSPDIAQCAGDPATTCTPLYRNLFKQYTQSSVGSASEKSVFTRYVQVRTVHQDREVEVVSTVVWQSHGVTQSVSVTDHLTAWH